ncbi:unnamed protein product, partial [Brenthis ino]
MKHLFFTNTNTGYTTAGGVRGLLHAASQYWERTLHPHATLAHPPAHPPPPPRTPPPPKRHAALTDHAALGYVNS